MPRSLVEPRGLSAVLALALLASAPRAQDAEPAQCPLPFYDFASNGFVPAPSPELCRALQGYAPPMKAILKAADFPEDAIGLWGNTEAGENAGYYHSVKLVMINLGTLKKHPKADAATLFVLAHEIGHAVQHRGGELAWKNSILDKGSKEYLRRNRIIEGQADLIATELLSKAGLGGARTSMNGVEDFFTCSAIQDERAVAVTHPTPKDRFLDQLKQRTLAGPTAARLAGAKQLDEAGLAAMFDAAGNRGAQPALPQGGPRVYKPSLGTDDFDAYGRPKTQGLRTLAVPATAARPAAQAPAGPDGWTKMAVSAQAAWDLAVDAAWFNNPAVESLALKSCGLPKKTDFNEAVAVGGASWLSETAADLTKRLRRLWR
ncbi:MAG: hypothetical protein HY928_14170 [Elusimicrobia bacterium]|nr:hypothetical protein [Elusimicrobiota bacterium]